MNRDHSRPDIATAKASAALAFAFCVAGSAVAQEPEPLSEYYSATAICAGPAPAYDAMLRKRPLGITNEGVVPVFVSCSVPTEDEVFPTMNDLDVEFTSMGGSGVVACNLIAGSRGNSTSMASMTTVPVGGTGQLRWEQFSRLDMWGTINLSCQLPPGVEINLISATQYVDPFEPEP